MGIGQGYDKDEVFDNNKYYDHTIFGFMRESRSEHKEQPVSYALS